MRKILLLLICYFGCQQLMAQNRSVTGKVTDDKGVAFPNASINVKGTRLGTTTNAEGNFTLSVPATANTLIISFVGYTTQEVAIGKRTSVDISLTAATGSLDEIVVTGYSQTRKKRDEAGAISQVGAKQIENLPNLSLDKALQGKAAGVFVQAANGIPGGAINVRIRGAGSINAGNDPLYIVDGVQMNTRSDASFTQSNPLSFLNPDDIQTIDIIKDAASAAIYGSNAANGVVIITTKKGRAGKTKFGFNAYYGTASPLKYFDLSNSQELFQLRLEGYEATNPNNLLANKRTVLSEYRVAGAAGFNDKQIDSAISALQTYDWQRAAFRDGTIKNYELSISGGNEKTTFRLSANHSDQQTIINKVDFIRSGLKIDLTNKATDRLTVNSSFSLSTFEQKLPFGVDGSFLGSPAFSAAGILPFNPIYNADGSYYGIPGGNPANLAGTLNQNIIAVNEFNTGYQRTNQLVGNLSLDYKISDWLSARVFGGIDYRLVQGRLVRDSRTPDAFARKGLTQAQSTWNTNINTYATLNANHTFNEVHKVDGLIGYEYRQENQNGVSASGDGFPTYQFTYLNNAANPLTVSEFFTGFRRNGVFGSVNYSYNSKYILGATLRYDGSSRFGADFRFGTFYGIKAAWNILAENFMKSQSIVSDLKLRVSYGTTGNDQVGNFDALGLFGGGGVYNGGAGISFSQLANPELRWEKTAIGNIGLDFGLFQNRVNGAIEVYDKQTSDVLLTLPLQSTTGFLGINSNIGRVQNKGVELTIGGDVIKSKGRNRFTWNTSFIFAYNRQQVKELFGGNKVLASNNSIRVGEPVNVLFTQRYAGVNPATGRPMFYDSLGNITYQPIAKDRVVLGPTLLAPYQGGFRNTFSYKGFNLDVAISYEYGRYTSDGQVNFNAENIGRINIIKEVYNNRWTAPGQTSIYPRMNINGTETKGVGAQSGNARWFKADYVRLRNVLLSYDVAPSVVSKIRLTSARFYIQGANLLTYSDALSYDVEFVGTTSTGIIPQTKNFTVGVQVTF